MKHNPLIFRYFVILFLGIPFPVSAQIRDETTSPHAAYYHPDSGFKPAQRDFTKIFLQLAGSLESHSSPEPYIRHVLAEHARISSAYRAATGKDATARPKYLTDDYVENLLTNWKKLTPGLKLDDLCRQSGRNMRLAIMGTWNMPVSELVAQEKALTAEEAAVYRRLLEKPYFAKSNTKLVDAFYAGPYDKLTDIGKAQLSKRVWLGTQPEKKREEIIADNKGGSLVVKLLNTHHHALMEYLTTDGAKPVSGDTLLATLEAGLKLDQANIKLDGMNEYERDAMQHSHAIKADFVSRFAFVDKNAANPEDAKNMKATLVSMVENLAVIANSEFRAGILEMESRSR